MDRWLTGKDFTSMDLEIKKFFRNYLLSSASIRALRSLFSSRAF